MRNAFVLWAALTAVTVTAAFTAPSTARASTFDHTYRAFSSVLIRHVVDDRVDYRALQRDRSPLDAVVKQLGQVARSEFEAWSPEEQIAYLINAYNAFTLQAIIDHYPIDGGWLSFLKGAPRSSIKQINGVWTHRRWRVAGQEMTLDGIEHDTLRTQYREPRIHFALNCASVSCPRLREEPYIARSLERQLMLAARDFLASDLGLQVTDTTLRVSSVFSWFGDDFVDAYAHLVDGGSASDRAVLGVIAKYGPADAVRVAQSGGARVRFLTYDWGLNDIQR